MMTTSKIFISLAALFCVSLSAAADTLEPAHIDVYGTAEIKVTPNEMSWWLTVRNEAKDLQQTAATHAETVKKVLEFLKNQGIDEEKLQTSRMQFGENWKYVDRERVKVGYFASTDIHFTITDLDLYEKLWFGLAGIDGVSIQGTQYGHSDRIRLQNECRRKALLAAREKAVALAETLGARIGNPLKIEEMAPSVGPMISNTAMNMRADMAPAENGRSLAPGQITISTQVRAVFNLLN